MTTEPHPPAHDLDWRRSASGLAIRARWSGLHVSIWRRPQGGPFHFTMSGTLPASITSTGEAASFLWERILHRIGKGTS